MATDGYDYGGSYTDVGGGDSSDTSSTDLSSTDFSSADFSGIDANVAPATDFFGPGDVSAPQTTPVGAQTGYAPYSSDGSGLANLFSGFGSPGLGSLAAQAGFGGAGMGGINDLASTLGMGGAGFGGGPGGGGTTGIPGVGGVGTPITGAGGAPGDPQSAMGTLNDPTFLAQQQASADQLAFGPPDPSTTAPGGQQSGTPDDSSGWMSQLSSLLGITPAAAAEAPDPSTLTGNIPPTRAAYDNPMESPATAAAADRSMILQNLREKAGNTLTSSDLSIPFGGSDTSTVTPPDTAQGLDYTSPPPDTLASRFNAVPEGQAVPADRVSAADQLAFSGRAGPSGPAPDTVSAEDRLAFSGQTAETPSDAGLRDRLRTDLAPANTFSSGGFDPTFSDRFANVPPGQAVPADRVSAADQLAFSGQTAETPGDAALGSRLGASLAPEQTFSSQGFDPTFADRFSATPPGQAVPADRISAQDQLALSGQTSSSAQLGGAGDLPDIAPNVPLPRSDPRLADSSVPIPRPAPTRVADTSTDTSTTQEAATAPSTTAPTTAPPTTPEEAPGAAALDRNSGVIDRQRRYRNPLHNAIAQALGGGSIGDMVASLLLQLGVPAALVMAGRGRGGGAFPMVGGNAAMRGAIAPQFARNVLPGPGLMRWGVPLAVGQGLDMQGRPINQGAGQPGQPVPFAGGGAGVPEAPQRGDFPATPFRAPPSSGVPGIPPMPIGTAQQTPQFGGGPGGQYDPNNYARSLIDIESGGNPNEVTGSNYGLAQFGPEEMRKYGVTNPSDPKQVYAGIQREVADHTNILRNALGRNPTPSELYLTHQQGSGGGPALLTAQPNTPAWMAVRKFYGSDQMAKRAIQGNIPITNPLRRTPIDQVTAGQFVEMWRARFNRAYIPNMRTQMAQAS